MRLLGQTMVRYCEVMNEVPWWYWGYMQACCRRVHACACARCWLGGGDWGDGGGGYTLQM